MQTESKEPFIFSKRPIGIAILILIFTGLATQNILSIVHFKNSPEHFFFAEFGLDLVAVFAQLAILLLNGASLFYLVRPTQTGFWVILYGIAFCSIIVSAQFVLMLTHLDILRSAYASSQNLRQISARSAITGDLFSSVQIALMYVISISVSGLALGLIVVHRAYFSAKRRIRIAPLRREEPQNDFPRVR